VAFAYALAAAFLATFAYAAAAFAFEAAFLAEAVAFLADAVAALAEAAAFLAKALALFALFEAVLPGADLSDDFLEDLFDDFPDFFEDLDFFDETDDAVLWVSTNWASSSCFSA
jgi:hypothetical protein